MEIIKSLVILQKSQGCSNLLLEITQQKEINVADFKKTPISEILDELKFIDMSGVTGATDPNAAIDQGFKVLIEECRIFVEGTEIPVGVMDKKNPSS